MENKKTTYGVNLLNSDCSFDSAGGFNTIEEAKEWARGRNGEYRVHIEDESWDNDDRNPLVCDYFITVTGEEVDAAAVEASKLL